jgi:hypothetical protein
MDKQETRLWRKFDRCRTRKCSRLIKERKKESNIFFKEQSKKCTQKNAKAFYNCSNKFYKGSTLAKISNKLTKCGKKKCSTEKKRLNTYLKKDLEKYKNALYL